MPAIILDSSKKSALQLSVAVVTNDSLSETSSLMDAARRDSTSFFYAATPLRKSSYSSNYEAEIFRYRFSRERVEHDSYYLSPSLHLHRNLGVVSVGLLIISKIFGSGIFATPAIVYQNVDGSPVLYFACWIVAMLVAYSGMLIYVEFSTLINRNGGTKTFLQFLYRRPKMLINCIVSITMVLFGQPVANSIIFAKYTLSLFEIHTSADSQDGQNAVRLTALLLLLFGTALYGTSVKSAVLMQNLIGTLKFLLLLVMSLASLYVVLPSNWTGVTYNDNLKFDSSFFFVDHDNFSMIKLTSLMLKCVASTGGYQLVAIFTGEVIDPNRTLRISCPLLMVIVFACYLVINLAYLSAIPYEEMMGSDELVGAVLFGKIFGQSFGSKFLTLSVAFSCFGNVLITIYACGRVNQELFREGFLPFSRFMLSNWPFSTPLPGLLLCLAISSVVLFLPLSNDLYDFIVNLDSYPSNFFALLIGLGVWKLRNRYLYLRDIQRAPLWCCALYVAVLVFLMVCPLVGSGGDKLFAYCGVSCLVGCAGYWVVYFKVMPWLGQYDLVQHEIVLGEGETMNLWERIYK